MNRTQVEDHYKQMGLEVEYGEDKFGSLYKPHVHERTYLYTLSGSLKIRVDGGDWVELGAGEEFIVGSGQLHEAMVGEHGWEYVAAWDAEEAKEYE